MRKTFVPCLVALLLLSGRVWSQDADNPKALIEKALQAQGGEQNSAKLKAMKAKAKGSLFVENLEIPFENEVMAQLPSQSRTVAKFTIKGMAFETTEILNGDKGWVIEGGQTKPADDKSLEEMKNGLYASYVTMLTPLLKEKTFELMSLGEVQVNGKAALGVKVASKGQKDIKLYFDKESMLLVKLVRPGLEPVKRITVSQEEYYSDYRLVDGVKQPHHFVVHQDGKKLSEGDWVQYTFVPAFEEKMFAPPQNKI